jgi:hypothetical protein
LPLLMMSESGSEEVAQIGLTDCCSLGW